MGYYVVETYSGRDADAADALANAGFMVYRPVYSVDRPHRRYKGVTITSTYHLMPGYLFLEAPPYWAGDQVDLGKVYQTDYILSVLGEDEDRPYEIPADTIAMIRKLAGALSRGVSAEDFWKENCPRPQVALSFEAGSEIKCQVGSSLFPGMVLEARGRDRYLVELKVAGRLKRVKVTSEKLKAA